MQMLAVAGLMNTFGEVALPILCYFSVSFHIIVVFLMAIWTPAAAAEHATVSFVLTKFNNNTGFEWGPYVAIIGVLAAGSTFTG